MIFQPAKYLQDAPLIKRRRLLANPFPEFKVRGGVYYGSILLVGKKIMEPGVGIGNLPLKLDKKIMFIKRQASSL